MRSTVDPFCFEEIVGTTKKSEVARVRPTAPPFRDFVIELEKGPGIAAPSVVRDERALPPVTVYDLATDRTSHVRFLSFVGGLMRPPRLASRPLPCGPRFRLRSRGSALLLLLELRDEQVGRALQYDR